MPEHPISEAIDAIVAEYQALRKKRKKPAYRSTGANPVRDLLKQRGYKLGGLR
jgi:hypothetical protein